MFELPSISEQLRKSVVFPMRCPSLADAYVRYEMRTYLRAFTNQGNNDIRDFLEHAEIPSRNAIIYQRNPIMELLPC